MSPEVQKTVDEFNSRLAALPEQVLSMKVVRLLIASGFRVGPGTLESDGRVEPMARAIGANSPWSAGAMAGPDTDLTTIREKWRGQSAFIVMHGETTLRASRLSIIFFQPATDFDFDTLGVLHSRLDRLRCRHLTFVFPGFMEGSAGRRLLEVRIKADLRQSPDAFIFGLPSSDRAAEITTVQDANTRYLHYVAEWLVRLDATRLIKRYPDTRANGDDSDRPSFLSGVKHRNVLLSKAVMNVVGGDGQAPAPDPCLPRRGT